MSTLEMQALVLNKHWYPIRQTTVRDALTMMAKGSAEAITEDYQSLDLETWTEAAADPGRPIVRTPRLEIPIPTVIRLLGYDKLPIKAVTFSRRNIFKRDKSCCQYCGVQMKRADEITIDHIVPRSKGGVSSWTNCVLACLPCNKRKANKTPQQVGMRLIRPATEPKMRVLISIPMGKVYQSWQNFVSERYWNAPLDP